MRRARSSPTSLPRNVGSSYSEEPSGGEFVHGKARICIEPVLGWLRRPHETWPAWARVFRHFIEQVRGLTGMVYGRRMSRDHALLGRRPSQLGSARIMSFAVLWRSKPGRWVMSRTLKSANTALGPTPRSSRVHIGAAIRGLQRLGTLGRLTLPDQTWQENLTDLVAYRSYRLYLRPVVLGRGSHSSPGPRPPLRLVTAIDGEDIIG